MKKAKIFPPMLFNSSVIFMILLHFIFPVKDIIPGYWKLLGIIPFFGGVSFNLITDRALKVNNTTVKPGEESEVLITGGIYKFSRNPMYLGMVMILAGVALFLGSLSPFFVIIIFTFLLDKMFIRIEEEMLGAKFGKLWFHYKKSTGKWI